MGVRRPSTARSWLLRRGLPFVLSIPIVAIPMAAILITSADTRGSNIPIAQGLVGGFHPVAGSFRPDETRLEGCGSRYSCIEQAFGNIAFTQGPRRAFAILNDRFSRNTDVERDCHRIVHTIGSAAYTRYEHNVARTFSEGSSMCASGYYHGILERAFVGITSTSKLRAVARRLCVDVGIRRRSFLDYQCRHGLGHGFMIQTGYQLPLALSLCSSIGSGWDRVTCTSGAFMENVNTRFGFRSSFLDEDRPLYPCTNVALEHRRSCFVRATTWILQVEGNDFGSAAEVCREAGRRWAPYCFRGLGRDAVVDARYRDFGRVHRLCALAGGFAGDCFYGAARTFGDGEGTSGVQEASRFCASAPAAVRGSCAAGFGIVVGLLAPTDRARRTMCARLTSQDIAACVAAAEAEVDPSGAHAWG